MHAKSLDYMYLQEYRKLDNFVADQVFASNGTKMVNLSKADGLRPLIRNKMMVASLIHLYNSAIEAVECMTEFLSYSYFNLPYSGPIMVVLV